MNRVLTEIKNVFWRRHLYCYDYFCGTNTMGEVGRVLRFLLTRPFRIVDGPFIDEYERKIARETGFKFAVSFATGRHALYAILAGMERQEGKDEILIQAMTCVTVPDAIRYAGYRPSYVDVGPHFNMDPAKFGIGLRARAAIFQATFGWWDGLPEIAEKCLKAGAFLIIDSAHTVGPPPVRPDAMFLSTDHTKFISTHQGGVALTDDDRLCATLHAIQGTECCRPSWLETAWIALSFAVEVTITHPRIYWLLKPLRHLLDRAGILRFFRGENSPDRPKRYPVRFTNIQALIGLMQLEKLEENRKHRERLAGYGGLLRKPVFRHPKATDKYFVKGRWFDFPVFGCRSLEELTRAGYRRSCPSAELHGRVISNLPIHPRVKEKHFRLETGKV